MAKKTTDIVPFTAETLAIAVDYTPFGEATSLSLTFSQVYNYIARPTRSGQKPSMADIMSFMKLCQSRQLNPYTGDAFLVGYDDSTKGAVFNLITSIHALFKRAEANEFTGGDLLFSEMGDNKPLPLKQGQAIFFASFLRHKVAPVKKGVRKSLVMWFGGPPFK